MLIIFLPVFWIFFILAVVFGLFYSLGRRAIFLFSPSKDNKLYEEELGRDKSGPLLWRAEQHLHIFFGVFLGWMLMWYLLDVRLSIFTGMLRSAKPDLFDLGIFLLAWVGINGRLPSIAHAIVDFMKSGKV